MRRYIPAVNGGVTAVYSLNDEQAPAPGVYSVQQSPKQIMASVQPAMQNFQYGVESVDVQALAQRVNHQAVVQTIQVTQPDYILQAPTSIWNTQHQQPLQTGRQDRYPQPNLAAPAILQSIPGYIVTQYQVTTSDINARQSLMYQNLRAPAMNEGNSYCDRNSGGSSNGG